MSLEFIKPQLEPRSIILRSSHKHQL